MDLFKSEKEKRKEELEKLKKDWQKTSEHTLGVSYGEAGEIVKKMRKRDCLLFNNTDRC